MQPFDANDYRKRVLAAVLARGGAAASDPFELYDLPLDGTLDDAAVAARLEEVWGFWQRHRDHPKYGALAADLVADHAARSQLLLPAARRAATASAVRGNRDTRDADRFALLDGAVRALVDRHGGVPRDKLDSLTKLALSVGLSEAEASARLAAHRVLDTAAAAPQAAPAVADDERRRQIRALLDELGAIWDCAPPVTLFALLDLEPDRADDRQIAFAAEAYRSRAREMPPNRLRTVLDEVLAHIAEQLERGPLVRERYLDSVAREVTERLRPRAHAAALVEDRLTADDAEVLVAAARELGLDTARAARLPHDLARILGVPVDAPIRPAPGTRSTTGTSAAAGSSNAGPSGAAQPAEGRIDYRKRAPGYAAPVQKARAALRAGAAAEAQRWIAEALARAGAEPPPAVTALRDEIAEALAAAQAPVPAPSAVTARRTADGSVLVAWQPPPGGPWTFRVQRRRPDGSWHTVGRTGTAELEDGGAPAGEEPQYSVVAISGNRASVEAVSNSETTGPKGETAR
ncbi:MAG: hypothetical protein ACT4QF_17825 [Sporichthyaceae bacterium]